MKAHLPTMFFMIIAASATLTLSVAWVAQREKKDGLSLWAYGLAVHTIGFSLIALRGNIDDFTSIVIGNTLLSCTYSMLLVAVAKFQQRTLPKIFVWLPPLLLALVFTAFLSSISLRIVSGAVISSLQILLSFIVLTDSRYSVSGRGKHLMIVGLAIMLVTFICRILSTIVNADAVQSITTGTPIQISTFLAAFVTLILTSNGFVLMIKERADERSRLLFMQDPLTGTWNRIRIEEAAQLEMARLQRYGHSVSLIMIDLDHFKRINDNYGHTHGDHVLKEFCQVVQSCIRSTDVLGRWGGEEFLVLLPNSGFLSTYQLAERIRKTLEQHRFKDIGQVTASFGFAVCQVDDTWETWLNRTDSAMYQAKAKGRNRVEAEMQPLNTKDLEHYDEGFLQLVWRESYASGNTFIDAQHKQILEHANILLKAMMGENSKEEIHELIKALLKEVSQHFEAEEAVLLKTNYVEFKQHCETHTQLLKRASELLNRYLNNQLNFDEIYEFLVYELAMQHMLAEDHKFYPLPSTV